MSNTDNRTDSQRSNPGRGFVPHPTNVNWPTAPCLLHAYSRRTRTCPVCIGAAAERKAWRDAQAAKLPNRDGVSGERLNAALEAIRQHPGVTLNRIEVLLGWSNGTVSNAVRALARLGLVESRREVIANGHQAHVWRVKEAS